MFTTQTVPQDPISLFLEWFEEVKNSNLKEPTSMTLASATKEGVPSARIVLLRHVDQEGFVFFTNTHSRKGTELLENPHAALCFYWMHLNRQVRVEGTAVLVSPEEADRYFANRPRGSQIGAWSSKQSEMMEHPHALQDRVQQYTEEFKDQPVLRPPYWSGFRIVPSRIEFWLEGEYRLHTRIVFTKTTKGWEICQLYP